jgi:ribosome-associated protein
MTGDIWPNPGHFKVLGHRQPAYNRAMHDTPENQPFERPSKSQRKRDMQRLQALGEQLAAHPSQTLADLPLSEDLQVALDELRCIHSREARRRQLQFVGRLMRSEDAEGITAGLARLAAGNLQQTRLLHRAEQWRDRLLSEGDGVLTELLTAYPAGDAQQLRQLLRKARQEREQARPPAAARQLLRTLRGLMAPG